MMEPDKQVSAVLQPKALINAKHYPVWTYGKACCDTVAICCIHCFTSEEIELARRSCPHYQNSPLPLTNGGQLSSIPIQQLPISTSASWILVTTCGHVVGAVATSTFSTSSMSTATNVCSLSSGPIFTVQTPVLSDSFLNIQQQSLPAAPTSAGLLSISYPQPPQQQLRQLTDATLNFQQPPAAAAAVITTTAAAAVDPTNISLDALASLCQSISLPFNLPDNSAATSSVVVDNNNNDGVIDDNNNDKSVKDSEDVVGGDAADAGSRNVDGLDDMSNLSNICSPLTLSQLEKDLADNHSMDELIVSSLQPTADVQPLVDREQPCVDAGAAAPVAAAAAAPATVNHNVDKDTQDKDTQANVDDEYFPAYISSDEEASKQSIGAEFYSAVKSMSNKLNDTTQKSASNSINKRAPTPYALVGYSESEEDSIDVDQTIPGTDDEGISAQIEELVMSGKSEFPTRF